MSTTAEEFVKIWQRAESVKEVCEKAGCSANAAYVRAVKYRRNGVPLKKFKTNRPVPLNWKTLKTIALEASALSNTASKK